MTGVMAPARPAWVPGELYPFTDRYIEIDGNLVHYVDEGTGPPLLLLHGNPSWSFGYREVIRLLADEFRCVALDYPGFGLSTARADYDFRPASHARHAASSAAVSARRPPPGWGTPEALISPGEFTASSPVVGDAFRTGTAVE